MYEIRLAKTEADIRACYPVMAQLRPHLNAEQFVLQVQRQAETAGFRLAYLLADEVRAVGGLRLGEWLSGGKYLEIEDLVTDAEARSKGYGGALFDWIVEYARRKNCAQIKLVSHVKRYGAHRFYLDKRMLIEAHYFSLAL